jgi:hypothetical protein
VWQPLASAALQQGLLLLIPAGLWAMQVVSRRYSARVLTASFLAYAWHFQSALLVNILAARVGIWSFVADDHLFYGVPIELVIGQAALLGPVNVLLFRHFAMRLGFAIGALVVIYAASSVIVAHASAGWGIAALAGFSVLPSLKVAEWTAEDRRVAARSLLQAISWVGLLFWVFPSSIFMNVGQSWQPMLERPLWQSALLLSPMLLPAAVIFSALRQFAIEGGGTAFPYDPPKRLVTGGVYAYLSNPMQVGICLAMAWWGVVTESPQVSLSAVVAVALFLAFKDVCNGSCAIGDQDPNWALYQREVPKWIPRRTAWILPK